MSLAAQCDLGPCVEDAVVVVHFFDVRTPYLYCADHGLRYDKTLHRPSAFARFGHWNHELQQWVTAVRREERLSPEGAT